MLLNKSLVLTAIFLITANIVFGQAKNEIDTALLRNHIYKVNTIQTTESDEDLNILGDAVKNVEILMLGEQAHGDGSTFLAKTRVIKYLHENLNFNVLVFESGLIDAYRVWKMIQEQESDLSVFDYGIFPIWAKSEQTQELFTYILDQSKTENPLVIAGFDMQPTGALMTPDNRWEELSNYLAQKIDFKENDYPNFSKVIKNLSVLFGKEFTEEDALALNKEFKIILQALAKNDNSLEDRMMVRYINNYHKTIILYSSADLRKPINTPHIFNIRDKEMYENLKFLKEEVYKDEKFIVWGANTHLGYGRGFLEDFQDHEASAKGMIPMGQYLKIDYQDKVYTLAFTSNKGKIGSLRGNITELPPALEISLEGIVASMGYENAFIDLHNEDLKTQRFATRIYGHYEMSGIWGQMCDGIFFINEMSPSILKTD